MGSCSSEEEEGCLSRQVNVAGEMCVVAEGPRARLLGTCYRLSVSLCSTESWLRVSHRFEYMSFERLKNQQKEY